jgi:hypothetical protein
MQIKVFIYNYTYTYIFHILCIELYVAHIQTKFCRSCPHNKKVGQACGRMMDVVVWETVICGPGLCVPWQHCFSSGNIVAGACFGRSGPQPTVPPSFISFREFIPGSELFWHPEKRG